MTHFLLCFVYLRLGWSSWVPCSQETIIFIGLNSWRFVYQLGLLRVKPHPSQKIKYKKQEWLNKSEYSVSIWQMHFLLLFSRQGKLRLQKWFLPLPERERKKIIKDMTAMVLARKPRTCNFLHWRDLKIVYKRWALNPDLMDNVESLKLDYIWALGCFWKNCVWRRLF